MAVWWEVILSVLIAIGTFLLTILAKAGYILSVQFLNFAILWQLLPIYTSWFAVEFITRYKEEQDISNRFMNSFSSLWVSFQLGEYIIQNIARDPYIIIKIIAVAAVAGYAIFLMRLVFLRKSITKALARVGEISMINIAVMLLVQDQIIISGTLDILYTLLAFLLIYFVFDFVLFKQIVERIYTKLKMPEEEKKEITTEPPPPLIEPRYERITKPTTPPAKPETPTTTPSAIGKPLIPPQSVKPPVQTPPIVKPPINQQPITQAPIIKPPISQETQPKPLIKKPE